MSKNLGILLPSNLKTKCDYFPLNIYIHTSVILHCVIAVCIEEIKEYMDNKIYKNNSVNLSVFSKGNSNDTKYFSYGFNGNLTHSVEKKGANLARET